MSSGDPNAPALAFATRTPFEPRLTTYHKGFQAMSYERLRGIFRDILGLSVSDARQPMKAPAALEYPCRVSVVQFYKAIGRSSADVVLEKVKRAHRVPGDGLGTLALAVDPGDGANKTMMPPMQLFTPIGVGRHRDTFLVGLAQGYTGYPTFAVAMSA